MAQFDFWRLLAGLGIFLFGMQLLESSVKDLSGKAFRRIIRNYTSTRLKAMLNGALVTALLQSSSAVSLMVLAFVGAGVMSMENAIGVILGSNIGTTLTAWIVAAVGFKIKIEALALPMIGAVAVGLIFFKPGTKPYYGASLVMGFGLLFLGLDFMKTSVEALSAGFDPARLVNLHLLQYVLIGGLMTAVMQASAATIAITLTALNSGLMGFEMACAMVIGANIGTTVTVLLGAMGGTPPKKRVAVSHLIFNVATGVAAFLGLPLMIVCISALMDIQSNGPLALALFHSLFNVTGVAIFLPLVPWLAALLIRFVPEEEKRLSLYLDYTPPEETDAACLALKNEALHLLGECQLYAVRSLQLDDSLVFDGPLHFEKEAGKKLPPDELYGRIKQLHSQVISYYAQVQTSTLDEERTRDLERVILASRNMIQAAKNFKGIRGDFDEFQASDIPYLNRQYDRFRRRLISFFNAVASVSAEGDPDQNLRVILETFKVIEQNDGSFIKNTVSACSQDPGTDLDLSTLFLVNRLFSQSCRMMLFSLKDLVLNQEQSRSFDRATEN